MGAAYLAGLASGYWKSKEEIANNRSTDKIFLPSVCEELRLSRIKGWNKAVKYSYGWGEKTTIPKNHFKKPMTENQIQEIFQIE